MENSTFFVDTNMNQIVSEIYELKINKFAEPLLGFTLTYMNVHRKLPNLLTRVDLTENNHFTAHTQIQ